MITFSQCDGVKQDISKVATNSIQHLFFFKQWSCQKNQLIANFTIKDIENKKARVFVRQEKITHMKNILSI
jgi:hypothetical protein